MSDYTATCYGIEGDHKYTNRTTAALGRNKDPNKGQKCRRLVIAAENEIMGGEIWVNVDNCEGSPPAIKNSDTFTITLTTTV